MSWPFVAAGWKLPVPPMVKLVALALGNEADMRGLVVVSNGHLQTLTGQSEQTVRRGCRHLADARLLEQLATGSGATFGRYQLHYDRGATLAGVPERQGCRAGSGGVPERFHSLDPLRIPKSIKAEAASAPPPRPPVQETPTRDQVAKLVHVVLDDDVIEIGEPGDLDEQLRRACAQAHFRYDSAVVDDGIKRALAARGHPDPKNWRAAGVGTFRRRQVR
jgi:hypothetical protein